jgi:hypothetical protein
VADDERRAGPRVTEDVIRDLVAGLEPEQRQQLLLDLVATHLAQREPEWLEHSSGQRVLIDPGTPPGRCAEPGCNGRPMTGARHCPLHASADLEA